MKYLTFLILLSACSTANPVIQKQPPQATIPTLPSPTPITFNWNAPIGSAPVNSYKLCAAEVAGGCSSTVSVNAPTTTVTTILDISKVWYAYVTAINSFGESERSNQVVLGEPRAPTGLTGTP